MRWSELEQAQPRLAEWGRQRLVEPGVLLVATIRRDGTPRLSPVEPLLLDGTLWLGLMWHSTKALDLLRDPRILVHSIITSRKGGEGEFKLRGRAWAQDDPAGQRRYADQTARELGWRPGDGRIHLFGIDIDEVTCIRYEDPGDQYVAQWPPGREFVRRATSDTSVGDPEPVHDLITAG